MLNIRMLYGALTIRYSIGRYSTSHSPSLATKMAPTKPCRIGIFLPLTGLKPAAYANVTHGFRQRQQIENLAIQGWRLTADVLRKRAGSLSVESKMYIYGLVDDQSYCDPAWKKIGGPQFACKALPTRCLHPQYGNIPTIDCVLATMSEIGKTQNYNFVVFANGDLIFPPTSFANTMQSIVHQDNNGIVLVGQRIDTTWQEFLGQQGARELAREQLLSLVSYITLIEMATMPGLGAVRHPDFGIDYFVMSTSIVPTEFSPFLVGRFRWDNALLAMFLIDEKEVTVVDATDVLPVLHVGEPYSSEPGYHDNRIGAEYNDAIAQQTFGNWYNIGRICNARWRLERKSLGENDGLRYVLQARPSAERPDHNSLIAISRAEGGPLLLIGVLPHELAHALEWTRTTRQNTHKSWFHTHFVFVTLDEETYDALEIAAPGCVISEAMTGWPRLPTAMGWKSFRQLVELQFMSVAIITASQLHDMSRRGVNLDTYVEKVEKCGAVMLQDDLSSINPRIEAGLAFWQMYKERSEDEMGAENGACWV